MALTLKSQREHLQDAIRRVIAYDASGTLTYFGEDGVARSLLEATSASAANADQQAAQVLNRLLLQNASGDALVDAAASRGTVAAPGARAKVLAVVQPVTSEVASVAVFSGSYDDITVADGSTWEAGDGVRIRYTQSGTTYSDARTVISKPSANVLRVDTLTTRTAAQYNTAVSTVEVMAIFRVAIPSETTVTSTSGVSFLTTAIVTTSDANPVMAGESTALGLADKVWCEATTVAAAGNIERLTLLDFSPTVRGVAAIFNPERGSGGDDIEASSDLKQRAIEGPSALNQDTAAWLLATAKAGNSDVLRLLKTTTAELATVAVLILKRNGGTFSSDEIDALQAYVEARIRSHITVTFANVTLTSVEVEAGITIEPGYTLDQVWREAANRLAAYLDYRRWPFGQDVDEAALLSIVRQTPGVASLVTSSFLPAADVSVGAKSLPILARLSLQNTATAATVNATLAVSF